MVSVLSSLLKDLRKHFIPIYEIQKKTKTFNVKKHLAYQTTPLVLGMFTANDKFSLESDASQNGGALFQFQQDQWSLGTYWLPFKETITSIIFLN